MSENPPKKIIPEDAMEDVTVIPDEEGEKEKMHLDLDLSEPASPEPRFDPEATQRLTLVDESFSRLENGPVREAAENSVETKEEIAASAKSKLEKEKLDLAIMRQAAAEVNRTRELAELEEKMGIKRKAA